MGAAPYRQLPRLGEAQDMIAQRFWCLIKTRQHNTMATAQGL